MGMHITPMKTTQPSNRGFHIQSSGIKKKLKVSENFIIDREFRDLLELLRTSGYETHMPSYLRRVSHNTKTLKTKLTADVIDPMCIIALSRLS